MADFLDMFLAAQQARRNEQQYRLAEMQRQELERQQMEQRSLQMARQQAAGGDLEELRVRAPDEAAGIERQRQLAGLRKAAATQDPAALEALAAFDPKDPWLEAVQRSQIGERDQKLMAEKVAREQANITAEQRRKDYSPELTNVSNEFGLRPEAGLNDPRVQAAMRGARQTKESSSAKDYAGELRKEFQGLPQVKDAITVGTAYKKIMSTSPTGAGDMSLIFAYMKLLDPNSTVREGEYATASQVGSIPQNIVTAYNRAISGDKLDPAVRQQFRAEASKVYGAAQAQYAATAKQYRRLAAAKGVNPDDAVLDLGVEQTMSLKDSAKELIRQGMTPEQAAQILSGAR